MTDKERLSRSVDSNEGYRSLPYKDTKDLYTFGKGRCLETNPLSGEEYRHLLDGGYLVISITERGADWLKWRELNAIERECASAFAPFWNELNDARQNVLIEMVYQMGMGSAKERKGVKGFVEMLKAIRVKDWDRAYEEGLDSDWHRNDSPARARELMLQLKTGEFQ